jgi:broad specificity phosphatase PhoE
MRYLEVRRHTMRVKQAQHLSQDGVSLARHLGAGMGPFERVVTSSVPRAFETAIAMGFAVDEQSELLATTGPAVDAELPFPYSFVEAAQAISRGGEASHYAHVVAGLWRFIALSISDGAIALVITHGGIIELGAVACLPEFDHDGWGGPCSFCEGVRLSFDGEQFVGIEILRVEGDSPQSALGRAKM